MKKTLSLFLAIVMVALMLPVSAIIASATGETDDLIHYVDFTKLPADDGMDGDINPTLMANAPGYVATIDSYLNRVTSISDDGLTLGGANGSNDPAYQTIAWNSSIDLPAGIINGTTDHILEFTWNTTYKFANMEFGWHETAHSYTPAATEGAKGTTNINYPNPFFRYSVCTGIGNLGGSGDGKLTGNDFTWVDKDGNEITNIAGALKPAVVRGDDIKMSIVVKGGYVAELHVTSLGKEIATYYPASGKNFPVKGYFEINLSGWAENNTVNIKSMGVKTLAENEEFTAPITPEITYTGKIVHSVDFAGVTDVDAVPYTFNESNDDGSSFYMKDGALWHKVTKNVSNASGIRIEKELFAGLTDYTVEVEMAPGSNSRILFFSFGLGDNALKEETNSWKIRMSVGGGNTNASDSWGIVKSNGTYEAGKDLGLGTTLIDDGFTARMIVNNNYLVRVEITTAAGQVIVLRPNGERKAAEGDLVISQNTGSAAIPQDIGIKSVKIVDNDIYYTALPEGELAMPAGKAVVKQNNKAVVVNAGAYNVDGLIAVKKSGGEYAAANSLIAEAGNVYAVVAKSDIAAMKLNAAGTDLRLASNPGIRFKSGFAAADFALVSDLTDKGAVIKVDMGTLITVKAFRDQVDEFTAEKLEALEGNTYMNVVADGNALYTETSFAGSVIGVKDLTRDYIAVGYVTVTFADNTSITVYTAEQTASVVGFANAIVEADEPNFDGYTEAEVEALKYIAALDDVAA